MLHPHLLRHNLHVGFHGCDERVRNRVIAGHETLNKSENDWDWLGHGLYFWENNFVRALEFANEQQTRQREALITVPSVIGAVFDLGYCLDLLDAEAISLLKPAYDYLCGVMKQSGKELPQNHGGPDRLIRELDCAVILMLHELRKQEGQQPFDTVRAAYIEGDPVYENAGFHTKNHIQICIINPDSIKGYFLPQVSGVPPLPQFTG